MELEKDIKSPERKKLKEQTETEQRERDQIEKMRTFEKRQEEFGRELETETLSKICIEAEDVNSEVKRLIESYIVDGDVEEMRKNMQCRRIRRRK